MKIGITAIKLPSGWYADLTNEKKLSFGFHDKYTDKHKIQHFVNYVNVFRLIVLNYNDFEFNNEFWFIRKQFNKERYLTKIQVDGIIKKYSYNKMEIAKRKYLCKYEK